MDFIQTCETSDLALVAALATCGIPLHPTMPCRRYRHENGNESYLFRFQPGHPDNGKEGVAPVYTADLMANWHDRAWLNSHPRHPLTFCKFMDLNRKQLLKAVHDAADFAVIEHHGKWAFVPLQQDRAAQDVILQELERPTL